jgi:Fic family protein
VLWRINWIHPFADGNGRTARAVSYILLSIKLDSLLPGTKTIPDQIAADKKPYYAALETADAAWKQRRQVDVSELEQMLSGMLAGQLLQAAKEAETEAPQNI